jgi:hypothetical protein
MKSNLYAAAMLFGLGFSAAGCIAGSDYEAPRGGEGEENVAEASQAWLASDPSRGWVDQIHRTCKNTWCTGPTYDPGEYKITGWACLNPSYSPATPLMLVVSQGGPPGSGTSVPILASEQQSRSDVVSAGVCANYVGGNGFGVWVDSLPNLPKVFYVRYVAIYPPALLEGTSTPDML